MTRKSKHPAKTRSRVLADVSRLDSVLRRLKKLEALHEGDHGDDPWFGETDNRLERMEARLQDVVADLRGRVEKLESSVRRLERIGFHFHTAIHLLSEKE